MGWLSGYSHRIRFKIDHTKIDSDLTHFPITLFLIESNANEVFTELGSNYKKIGITQADGTTQLYVEVEKWDSSSKEAVLHISRSGWTISSSQNTVFYLYYDSSAADNTSYVGDIGDTPAQNVWDSNFKAVYHMCQDPSGGTNCIKDSTSNANHGTPQGSMTSGDLVDGLVNGAIDFDGSDDYIDCGNSTSLDITSTLTLEAILCPGSDLASGLTAIKGIISKQHVPTLNQDTYCFFINKSGKLQMGTYGGNIQSSKATWTGGVDYYVAGTYESSTLSGDLFINGIKETLSTDNYDTMSSSTNDLTIGVNSPSTNDFWEGKIEEVRVSNVVRSDAWIKATYYSLFNQLVSTAQDSDSVEFKIDHTKIDSDLTHFPVTLFLNSVNAGEIFQELAYPLDDDFSGNNGDDPDTKKWTKVLSTNGAVSIQSNKLHEAISTGASSEYTRIKTNYVFEGDFDIQIDFSSLSLGNNYNYAGCELKVYPYDGDSNNQAYIKAGYHSSHGGNMFMSYIKIGGTSTSTFTSRSNNNGKLRLVKSGGSITTYYQDGSGSWVPLDSKTGFHTKDYIVLLGLYSPANNGNVSVNYDNFTVNSGVETWLGTGNQAHLIERN